MSDSVGSKRQENVNTYSFAENKHEILRPKNFFDEASFSKIFTADDQPDDTKLHTSIDVERIENLPLSILAS